MNEKLGVDTIFDTDLEGRWVVPDKPLINT